MPTLETQDERRRSVMMETGQVHIGIEPQLGASEFATGDLLAPPQQTRPITDPAVYGYHNIFHTHSQPSFQAKPPPSYVAAKTSRQRTFATDSAEFPTTSIAPTSDDVLPAYSCDVIFAGVVGLKHELSSPFRRAPSRKWQEVFVVLQGTQLTIHKVYRKPGRRSRRSCNLDALEGDDRPPSAGRRIKAYTLQHAEVGVALDFRKTEPVPKNAFTRLIPSTARERMYETDPHLFEPVREFVIRLRVETEQILLSCNSQDDLMDWVEMICTGIDISNPLEVRSEPRYRSLPRRNRRQRQLEAMSGIPEAGDAEAMALVEEQERIIRRLYPHLADQHTDPAAETSGQDEDPAREQSVASQLQATTNDPEADDLDRSDFLMPGQNSATGHSNSEPVESRPATPDAAATSMPFDPKTAIPRTVTPETLLRYRRRCAPILLFASPRASDVLMYHGSRVRVDPRAAKLIPFMELPPRYDAHKFTPEAITVSLNDTNSDLPSSISESVGSSGRSSPSDTSADSESGNADRVAHTPATTPPSTAPPSLLRGTSYDSYRTPAEEITDPIPTVEIHAPAGDDLEITPAVEEQPTLPQADTSDGDHIQQDPVVSTKCGRGRRPRSTAQRLAADGMPEKRRSWFSARFSRKITDDDARNVTMSLQSMGLVVS